MRSFVLAAAIAVVTTPLTAQDCADGLRPFQDALGVTCIPESPQRIASLRDDSVTTTLMDIGAPVFATVMRSMEDGSLYWYERDILVGYTFESLDRSIDFLTALTAGRDFD